MTIRDLSIRGKAEDGDKVVRALRDLGDEEDGAARRIERSMRQASIRTRALGSSVREARSERAGFAGLRRSPRPPAYRPRFCRRCGSRWSARADKTFAKFTRRPGEARSRTGELLSALQEIDPALAAQIARTDDVEASSPS